MGSNVILLKTIESIQNLTIYLKPGELAVLYENGEDDIGHQNRSDTPQYAFEVTNESAVPTNN